MRVSTRLYLMAVPGILGVLAVAGLAYWGRYQYRAPELLVAVGAVACVASLLAAVHSARYVAGRIDALARRRPDPAAADGEVDELERIERSVAREEAAGRSRAEQAEARAAEYQSLLRAATGAMERALSEVRLPLHILLENRFGDLNENQEEMLGAAEQAAQAAGAEIRAVSGILAVDAGSVAFRAEPVRPRDLVAPLLPVLQQRGRADGFAVHADISPALPHVVVDVERTREALDALLRAALEGAAAAGALEVTAEAEGAGVRLTLAPAPADAETPPLLLARRLLAAQGISLRTADGVLRLDLPRHA